MKPLGIKLAAGAVTILFGAYAAALAQRDKQKNTESWSAQTPSLGEPATPIADISEETWLSQPASDDQQSAPTFSDSAVQLVQHTEPAGEPSTGGPSFDASVLPASLGAEGGAEGQAGGENQPAAEVVSEPNWTLPPAGDASPGNSGSDSPAASPGLTMSLPADAAAAQPQPTASQPTTWFSGTLDE